jgi:solute carrier family 25 uncoupling protein 8/9
MPPAVAVKQLPFLQLFAASATAASVGEVLTIPIDTCKVRLQLQGRSSGPVKYHGTLHTLTTVAREEGVRSLWKGLVPGLHRQVLLGGVRIASYDPIRDFYGRLMKEEGGKTSLPTKVAAALTAGTLGVLVGNPTDCLKVRMQAQGKLPPGTPPKYPSAMQAYGIIARQEGLKALWTGTSPNILRNSVVNAAELATYDQIKQTLMRSFGFQDNVYCHLASSLCAGFLAVMAGSPFDVVKSRAMALSQQGGYKGVGDVVMQTFRKEGPLAFWSGFGANFLRLGSWNIAMFLTLEQLRKLMGAAPAKH